MEKQRCTWIITKGQKFDQECIRMALNGQEYCRCHSRIRDDELLDQEIKKNKEIVRLLQEELRRRNR